MAIIFDNAVSTTTNVGTNPYVLPYTVGNGGGAILYVGITYLSGNDAVPTSVTYNDVAMTQIVSNHGQDIGSLFIYQLANPSQGAGHNISINLNNNTGNVQILAMSYVGVDLTAAATPNQDSVNTVGSATISRNLTSTQDNSWMATFGICLGTGGFTVNTGITQRTSTSNGGTNGNSASGDSNASVGVSGTNYTQTWNAAGSARSVMGMFEIPALPPVNPNVSDATISVTESVAFVITTIRALSVNDSVSYTENIIAAETFPTAATASVGASVLTSAYKWLTSTLLAAQQSFALRPYVQAKILDDTIQPNQIFSGTPFPIQGTAVQAPDGSLLAAGYGGGGIFFYKAANFHTATWDQTTLLLSSVSDPTILSGLNRVVITCSDWINGSYHIDVFFYNNFVNSSSNLNVQQYYSDDSGTTWNSRIYALTDMPSNLYIAGNPLRNLSLTALKPRLVSGVLNSAFMYLHPNGTVYSSGYYGYEIKYVHWTGSAGLTTTWNQRNVDSKDWTLHSLESFYLNGRDYVVFSGFKNILDPTNPTTPNYAVYVTSIITDSLTSGADLWAYPRTIISSLSSAISNHNSFTYPRAIVSNGVIYLTFAATTVDSVSQSAQGASSTLVTNLKSVMLCRSMDGESFSYPTPFVFPDGTVFVNDALDTSFVPNGNYYYLGPGIQSSNHGKVWEYVQNNILADVSADVIDYKISESAGQPSSINLRIGNQNGQWVGSAPTQPGAAAIAGNRRIQIFQGYYNASGVPETAPRNTYYIDDVTQSTSASENDVIVTGRDLYKKLKTTVTKFAFLWVGPFLHADIFDGSTLIEWAQKSGTWQETANTMVPVTAPTSDASVTLTGIPGIPYASVMYVNIKNLPSGTTHVYAYYVDASNWLRWEYNHAASAWAVFLSQTGSLTTLDSGTFTLNPNTYYPIIVRQYDYYKFNFMIANGGITHGNDVNTFTNVQPFRNSTNGEYNVTASLVTFPPTLWTVGLGCNGNQQPFMFFKYMQYRYSNSIADLVRSLATKARIFSYDFQTIFTDYFHQTSQYTGTFTAPNRLLTIAAGNSAVSNTAGQIISNGEISFTAKASPVSAGTTYGFQFFFRSPSGSVTQNGYAWHIKTDGATGIVYSRFEVVYLGTNYPIPASIFDSNTPTAVGSLNVDLTKVHTFRIFAVDAWMFAFIDGVMVNAWNDNNTTFPYFTTGQWGWGADANTTLYVSRVSSPSFYKQIPSFSLNPGDDAESAIEGVFQTVRGWFHSDLFGVFKAIFLLPTDAPTYTYNTQLYVQATDTSDKEYISQVTVYGSGVSATARDALLISKGVVREEVVVDYQITTQQDAQARAQNELTHANQFRSQYSPKQVVNVGAELFDSITVVNTGNNTTGVNAGSRTYAQSMEFGGKADYYMQIEGGNL